jgi:hypothetical protein
VEELISRARKRAEDYLFKEIEGISNGIKNKNQSVLCPQEWDNLHIRFEAHAYLCHRNINLKPKYAKELRELWLYWKSHRVYLKPKALEIFYPAAEYYYPENEESPVWEPFDPSWHIPMLRSKEILEMPGFDDDFNKVMKIIKNHILGVEQQTDPWLVFRSLIIQNNLLQYIQNISRVIKDKIDIYNFENSFKRMPDKEQHFHIITGWIFSIFYLVMSRLGGVYLNKAQIELDKIISLQEKNGSILDDIMTTCSLVVSICLAGIDKHKVVQNKALQWLLCQQNKDGSWSHWIDKREKKPSGWSVLATVIVMETIDLITNSKPLPPWATEYRAVLPHEKKRKAKDKIDVTFPIPDGCGWEDVRILFLNDFEIELRIAKKPYGKKDFKDMGFVGRNPEEPGKLWKGTLILLAKTKGELSRRDYGVLNDQERVNLRKNISLLREKLKRVFDTEDDPFHPSKYRNNIYRTKIQISYRESNDFEGHKMDKEIAGVFKKETEGKVEEYWEDIQKQYYREAKTRQQEPEDDSD